MNLYNMFVWINHKFCIVTRRLHEIRHCVAARGHDTAVPAHDTGHATWPRGEPRHSASARCACGLCAQAGLCVHTVHLNPVLDSMH